MNPLLFSASAPRRHGGLATGLLFCLVLAGAAGWFGYTLFFDSETGVSTEDLITREVTREPFDHVVLEQGEIESSSNTELVCEVESRGSGGVTILWVIDEGARVEKGDKLVELDSSQLEVQKKESTIEVISAEAAVSNAAALLEQAKIARQEYLEGVFKTEEKTILSEKAIAEQDLRKAQLALQSTERLVAKGLVKSLQLDADKYAVANAQNQVDSAEGRLRVLRELTKEKMLVQFDSDIDAAQAQLSAAEAELVEERQELAEVEQQIENCVIHAPSSGVVVHANEYSRRGGNAEFVVEAGATVREQQAIIRLPDPDNMQVSCNINESRVTLLDEGMPAKITVDALPGMQLRGRVIKVNRYAEPGGWMSSAVKEYKTLVQIVDPPGNIRTGMTAQVRIFVEQLKDAVQIPIQGLYEHGGQMYTLVQTGPKSFETRAVTIGATNDVMAHIEDGLQEGEQVVLNLRQHLNLMDLPELEREDTSDLQELVRESEGGEDAEQGPGGPGEGRDRGGPGGGSGPQAGGGPGAGGSGPGGGGRPSPAAVVQRQMQQYDSDGDGTLSAEELEAIDSESAGRIKQADSDGDGSVTRSELQTAIQQRMNSGGGGTQ